MMRKREKNIYQEEVLERPVRKAVQFSTQLIIGDERYDGFVINISAHGVGMFVNTSFPESTINCTRGSVLGLELETPTGELLKLQCEVRWIRIQESPSEGLITSMGMQVIAPPPTFIELFNNLL
jgi:hypothetical protein